MTIVALVKAPWVVENLQLVGGGSLFHLCYDTSQLSVAALRQLAEGKLCPETPIDIYWECGNGMVERVADGHLAELVQTGNTLRLHVRLLRVRPYVAKDRRTWFCPGSSLAVV